MSQVCEVRRSEHGEDGVLQLHVGLNGQRLEREKRDGERGFYRDPDSGMWKKGKSDVFQSGKWDVVRFPSLAVEQEKYRKKGIW